MNVFATWHRKAHFLNAGPDKVCQPNPKFPEITTGRERIQPSVDNSCLAEDLLPEVLATLYAKQGFGFAVRDIDLNSPEQKLRKAIQS